MYDLKKVNFIHFTNFGSIFVLLALIIFCSHFSEIKSSTVAINNDTVTFMVTKNLVDAKNGKSLVSGNVTNENVKKVDGDNLSESNNKEPLKETLTANINNTEKQSLFGSLTTGDDHSKVEGLSKGPKQSDKIVSEVAVAMGSDLVKKAQVAQDKSVPPSASIASTVGNVTDNTSQVPEKQEVTTMKNAASSMSSVISSVFVFTMFHLMKLSA